MFLLAIALLLLISSWGCNGTATPSDRLADSSSEQQEGTGPDESGGGGIVEAIQNQSLPDAPGEPVPDDQDELLAFLNRKQMEQQGVRDPKAQLQLQRQRSEACRKLLEMKLTSEQRLQVVRSQLDALLRRGSLGDVTSRTEFLEFASKMQNHPNPRIAEAVAVASLYNELGRQAGANQLDLEPVVAAARHVAGRFPESYTAMREVATFADGLLRRGEREAWRRIMHELVDVYGNSQDEQVQTYLTTLASRLQIAELNLDVIMNDIRDQAPQAIDQYRSVANQMLADPQLDAPTMDQLLGSISWLERNELREEALEANRIVLAASLNMHSPELRERLQQICELRETRLSMVGQSFAITGQTARGIPFDWNRYATDYPVMVVFWTPSEPTSVTSVRSLAGAWEQRRDQGLKFLAVNVSTSGSSPTRLFGDELPEWALLLDRHSTLGVESSEADTEIPVWDSEMVLPGMDVTTSARSMSPRSHPL